MAFYGILKNDERYPRGTDKPGQAGWIANRLLRLRAMLNGQITARRRSNSLIIGSWNIRHFDGGRPRADESMHYIAEIIDHFDICAIQEVKDISSMKRLMRLLGPDWDFFINDSSGGGRGNHERMAFAYNRKKLFFRHLIGELVFPKDALPGGEQIGRTPFFASFQAGWFKFTLCNAHIVFAEEAGRPLRKDEINAIASLLRKRARKQDEVHVFLGDMNIEDPQDGGMEALRKNKFIVPELGGTSLNRKKHYDQITFTGPANETHMLNFGTIDWQEAVYTADEAEAYRPVAEAQKGEPIPNWPSKYRQWTTHEMSDHLPVWIEIEVDYSNEYLRGITKLEA